MTAVLRLFLRQHHFQPVLSLFPIGEHLFEEAVEFRAVVVMLQMTEFVDDHVVNAIHRRPDERYVQGQQSIL